MVLLHPYLQMRRVILHRAEWKAVSATLSPWQCPGKQGSEDLFRQMLLSYSLVLLLVCVCRGRMWYQGHSRVPGCRGTFPSQTLLQGAFRNIHVSECSRWWVQVVILQKIPLFFFILVIIGKSSTINSCDLGKVAGLRWAFLIVFVKRIIMEFQIAWPNPGKKFNLLLTWLVH